MIVFAMQPDVVVDARGFCSPIPLMRARSRLMRLKPGQILELITTDKKTKHELHVWAFTMGYEIIDIVEEGKEIHIFIRKK